MDFFYNVDYPLWYQALTTILAILTLTYAAILLDKYIKTIETEKLPSRTTKLIYLLLFSIAGTALTIIAFNFLIIPSRVRDDLQLLLISTLLTTIAYTLKETIISPK